jgi:hypothetical protein
MNPIDPTQGVDSGVARDKPRFIHDSTCCQFLGRSADGERDLYTCNAIGIRTFIARYGDDGDQYQSLTDMVLNDHETLPVLGYLVEARNLVQP